MAPAFAVFSTSQGRERMADEPVSLPLMIDRLRGAERRLALVRGLRAVVLMADSFLLVLWFCETGGLISARSFVLSLTVICTAASAIYFPWLARRERLLIVISATLFREVDAFKTSRGWDPS
jgi:hypothetical protein